MDSIGQLLFDHLNVHVFGPAIPQRQQPIDCYLPWHQAYPARPHENPLSAEKPPRCDIPGAVPRKVERDGGPSWVYDRDVVTTWRLPYVTAAYDIFFWENAFRNALGQESMWIAVEAFLDEQPGPYEVETLLDDFGQYISKLGTQPLTITITSLVADMVQAYKHARLAIHDDLCADEEVADFAEHFVLSRDCFFYPAGRAPVVEATFWQCSFGDRTDQLDVQIYWAPPLLSFHELCNVVYEGEEFAVRPTTINTRVYSSLVPFTARYLVGPTEPWLHWDGDIECWRGIVPASGASMEGAERLEAYTITLEVTAIITKHFGGGIDLEREIRCAIPLTVKRRPDQCAVSEEPETSPPLKSMSARFSPQRKDWRDQGRSPLKPLRNFLAHMHITPHVQDQSTAAVQPSRPTLPHTRSAPLRAFSLLVHEKENAPAAMSMRELHQSLKLKAACPKPPSPLPLNSLSLARYYDAFTGQHVTCPSEETMAEPANASYQFGTPLEIGEAELVRSLGRSMHERSTTMVSDSSEGSPKVRRLDKADLA